MPSLDRLSMVCGRSPTQHPLPILLVIAEIKLFPALLGICKSYVYYTGMDPIDAKCFPAGFWI